MNISNDALIARIKVLLYLQGKIKYYNTSYGAASENLSSFEVARYMRKNDRAEARDNRYDLAIRDSVVKLYKNGYPMEKLYQQIPELEDDILHVVPELNEIKDGEFIYSEPAKKM